MKTKRTFTWYYIESSCDNVFFFGSLIPQLNLNIEQVVSEYGV